MSQRPDRSRQATVVATPSNRTRISVALVPAVSVHVPIGQLPVPAREHMMPEQSTRYESDAWQDHIQEFLGSRSRTTPPV
jgi:hypothetical protein